MDSEINKMRNCNVRVCPETLYGIAKFSKHEPDRCEAQERERLAIEALPILGKPSASVEPRNGALDDPSFRYHDEGVQFGALDDFDDPIAASRCSQRGTGAAIAGIGEDANYEGKQRPRAWVENESGAVAILDIGGMYRGAQQ